jgi:class 3 adenylate cyclase
VHKDVCEGKDLVFRGPRIHCGLSSGTFADGDITGMVPDARTGRAQYHGQLCNHAARVSSIAHGGQIVASDSTVAACDQHVLDSCDVQLKDLGLWQMKGFGGEHRIWQVCCCHLSAFYRFSAT